MHGRWAAFAAALLVLSACSTAVSGRGQAADTATSSSPDSTVTTETTPPEDPLATDTVAPGEDGGADTTLDGSWTGRTSQDRDVTFTVANGSITRISVAGRYGGATCPITSTDYTMTGGVDINGRRFTVGPAVGGGANIEGTFTSDRQATGTAEFVPDVTARDMRCLQVSVTWTAARS